MAQPEPYFTLRGHNNGVSALTFLNDGETLCSGDSEGNVHLWRMQTHRTACSFKAHDKGVLSLQNCFNGHVLSQGRDGTTKVWDISTQQPLCELAITTDAVGFGVCDLFQRKFHDIKQYDVANECFSECLALRQTPQKETKKNLAFNPFENSTVVGGLSLALQFDHEQQPSPECPSVSSLLSPVSVDLSIHLFFSFCYPPIIFIIFQQTISLQRLAKTHRLCLFITFAMMSK
jgi:WD40 repeat protein